MDGTYAEREEEGVVEGGEGGGRVEQNGEEDEWSGGGEEDPEEGLMRAGEVGRGVKRALEGSCFANILLREHCFRLGRVMD